MNRIASGKKAYRSPRLTRYGSVASLTKGGSGTRPDGCPGGMMH